MKTLTEFHANWPAPENIFAFTTTRQGGQSLKPFDSNNMGLHVGDVTSHVIENRQALYDKFGFVNEPVWLEQIHSPDCIVVEKTRSRVADAAITCDLKQVLVIMTADCLPILICDNNGTEIAAVHAGWRGLASGVLENTLQSMQSTTKDLLAWIGPGICRRCFAVGPEVKQAFTSRYPMTETCFLQSEKTLLADLAAMAEMILNQHGVMHVFHANQCTFENAHQWYSYRRQPQTGRMATFIGFKQGK